MNLDSYLLYMWGGMLITWVTLSNSKRYRSLTKIERFHEVAFCCSLTAALAWIIIDYFTGTPKSIVLFIGAMVGTIGPQGWVNIVDKIVKMLLACINRFIDHKTGTQTPPDEKK